MDNSSIPDDCQYAYWLWVAIMATLVIPTSCMDLTDQVCFNPPNLHE